MNRANSVDLRQGMQMANEFTKMGLGFIPVPYTNETEKKALAKMCDDILEKIIKEAEKDE